MPEKISKYFTLQEAIKSEKAEQLGLDNRPDDIETLNAIIQTGHYMDEIRDYFNKPVYCSSWHRNKVVNKAVGGVDGSQHQRGEAVDFGIAGMTPAEICLELKPRMAEFHIDQLILEPSWVHVSFVTHPDNPRTSPRNQFIIDKRVRRVDIPKGLL